jgi:adenylyltransferase/sulfurtransferase
VCGEAPTITGAAEMAAAACLDHARPDGTYGLHAAELADALAGDAPPLLVDVREDWEHRAGHLPRALHMPLGDVQLRADELPRDRDIVLYCRVGPRGERAAEMLAAAGFTRVRNLRDGLVAWREEIDADQVVA